MASIQLYSPDSTEPPFQPANVPYAGLMGRWHVVASTLPMWKGKKNVTITYSPIEGQPQTTFDDIVEYHSSLSAEPGSSRKTVRGIDRPEPSPLASGEPASASGGRWKWRGKGWLMIASSHWQLLGYNVKSDGGPDAGEEWVVTYFSKTLFTPAGLDVYARTGTSLSDETRKAICEAAKQVSDPTVSKIAADLFDVPHDM